MKISDHISVSKSGFVFDSKTGESFSLNNTGREILELLIEGRSEDEIKEYFLSRYNVPETTFLRHLDDYTQMLMHFNMTEKE